jgi:hypothetical protein
VAIALGLLGLLLVICAAVLLWDRPVDDQPEVRPPAIPPSYRLLSDLYAIRRRFNVARFKCEVRLDAAHAHRNLRAELRELERGEGEP